MIESQKQNYSGVLLLTGALIGLGVAFFEAVFVRSLPEASIASVNGAAISKNEFNHTLLVLSQGRAGPLTQTERKQVLESMIDNELLLQRANQLGLAQSHPELRRALIRAMITFILDNADRAEPSEATLRTFYQEHRARFQISERLQLRRLYFSLEHKAQAEQAAAKLKQGVAFSQLKGDDIIEPPRQPVPLETLYQYLGKAMTLKASEMKVGQPSPMLITDRGYFFLLVEKKIAAQVPLFSKVKQQIKREWEVYQDGELLENYIKTLRSQARIEINQ
jgi:parvulin-like peptidyl-prolyl isomerase